MATENQKTNFITNVRVQASNFLNAVEELNALLDEWNRNMNAVIVDGDFIGDNNGLVTVDISNVLGTTLTAINGLGNSNYTNLYKIKRNN